MVEITDNEEQALDISTLPYDEAIEVAIELLGFDRPEAVLYVQISQGVIDSDTYILQDENGSITFPTQ